MQTVLTELADAMLENTSRGGRHPKGKPREFTLFVWRYKRSTKTGAVYMNREVEFIKAPTLAAARQQLRQFVRKHKARVLDADEDEERRLAFLNGGSKRQKLLERVLENA